MRLPKKIVEQRVKALIKERYGKTTVTFDSMIDIMWDLIEEREKYRDRRA